MGLGVEIEESMNELVLLGKKTGLAETLQVIYHLLAQARREEWSGLRVIEAVYAKGEELRNT